MLDFHFICTNGMMERSKGMALFTQNPVAVRFEQNAA